MTDRQNLLRTAIGGTGLALLLMLRATGAEAAGPTPVADFAATATITTLSSDQPVDAVLGCYLATASQPSFAHVARREGGATIRLRFDGLMFETLAFAATPDGGTQVTVQLSGAYDRADRRRHAALRGTPLAGCVAPATARGGEIAS
jgi:hypothetical protein